ncbi:hypothetical protein [Euzebya sp.]|uniref:hypothetical protein n=1 Tax=Euzebya sp. TaxID=1971409 RepID=UPI003514C3B0
MLIPWISVTAIGLWAGFRLHSRAAGTPPVIGAGVVGAWVGFLVGGFAGAVFDVLMIGGFWPFLFGHVGAAVLGRIAASNRARAAIGA